MRQRAIGLTGLVVLATCSDATAPPAPASMEAAGGDGQAALVGNPLADALAVRVMDRGGRALPGVPVAWRVVAGGGTVDGALSTTDGAGLARMSWTLGATEGEQRVRASADGELSVVFTAVGHVPTGRAFEDLPDDLDGPQVHVAYVVPADGVDRALDADGVLARSLESVQVWLRGRSGLSIRFDTHGGALDVTFNRLAASDAEISASDPYVVDRIASELEAAGHMRPDKHYLVFYDGSSDHACGGAHWPPRIPGRTAAMYLKGTPGGAPCPSEFVASADEFPRYWEFAAVHDLIHTFGVVSDWAPHHVDARPAHVPEPNDLMYGGGSGGWILDETTTVDVGGDDYFGPAVPVGIPDLGETPFLEEVASVPAGPAPAPPSARRLEELAEQARRLPAHPPFPRRR